MTRRRWKRGRCGDRVVEILRASGPTTSSVVASRLWPDSDGWDHARGAQGLARAAARILHRLRREGRVSWDVENRTIVWRAR